MKRPLRVIFPLAIVSLLVLITGGIAFAREIGFMQKSGEKQRQPGLFRSIQESAYSIKSAGALRSSQEEPPDEMEITGTVETILTDTWTVSGQVFSVTLETEIEDHIVVGDKVKVELFYDDAHILTASQIELLSGEDQHLATTEFTGTVEALSLTSATVSGHVLAITSETEMDSGLKVGDKVKVEALVNQDGSLVAKQIELLEQDSDEEENQNGECHEGDDDEQGDEDDHPGQTQVICQNEDQGEQDEHEGNQAPSPEVSRGDEEHEGDD